MKKFLICTDTNQIDFHHRVVIDLSKPIYDQLERRKLYIRVGPNAGDRNSLKRIIEDNASLKVSFGWSFESSFMFYCVMIDCVNEIIPKFSHDFGDMISNNCCDWLGFVPFTPMEAEVYKDFDVHELIAYNNELIDYQTSIIKYITQHILYRQHAICRDKDYRFDLFKAVRKNPVALANTFDYYVTALKETSLLPWIPRDLLEEQIGCHFLYFPDVFFETLEFLILRGDIKE